MTSTPPATIKLFLPFGDPTRLRTAELSNWSGKALAAPRSDLAELFERDEIEQSGVYVLTGVDSMKGDPVAYVGEAEVLRSRLKQHAAKDFWNQVLVFVSKDENLTKAHVRYLEGALILEATTADRMRLLNAQASGSRLPEADRADMDVYLSKVRQMLPVLGSPLLTPTPSRSEANPSPEFSTSISGLTASGRPTSGGFVVFEGSCAVRDHRPSASASVRAERDRLLDEGDLAVENGHFIFTRDTEFSSPSMAASVVKGGNTNGLTNWKTSDGVSLKDLESRSTSGPGSE